MLIIKLGALGDVVRTTPLLSGLRKKYGEGIHITWVTSSEARPLLENNPLIDRLYALDIEVFQLLEGLKFDLAICLDKEERALSIASLVRADEKGGFVLSPHGNVAPADKSAVSLFNLGIDDEMKFKKNKKSYQDMVFTSCGLEFAGEECVLEIPEPIMRSARERFSSWDISSTERVIGLNLGSSARFESKRWPHDNFRRLADVVRDEGLGKVLLLGGPAEESLTGLEEAGGHISTGFANPLVSFAALLSLCSAVVTADTLAMHLAIAKRIPVVALFGPTVQTEIEFYGRGVGISSSLDCAPCLRPVCENRPNCMDTISPESVLEVLKRLEAERT